MWVHLVFGSGLLQLKVTLCYLYYYGHYKYKLFTFCLVCNNVPIMLEIKLKLFFYCTLLRYVHSSVGTLWGELFVNMWAFIVETWLIFVLCKGVDRFGSLYFGCLVM